jgi:hypothetical protein
MEMKKLITICLVVLFVSNVYAADTLVYDTGTDPWSSVRYVQHALDTWGIPYDVRDAAHSVTPDDLASHNLLIIGFNNGGDMDGISASVLASGITGKILLTGHDPDDHYYWGYKNGDAGEFLSQAISWARGSDGSTGLVALGDMSTAFSYLPSGWDVSAIGGLGEDTIISFTAEGLESGVYNGLTTENMSGWCSSYHAYFTNWGAGFVPFEIGENNQVVTIATPEPATICLLGLGAALSLVTRKK